MGVVGSAGAASQEGKTPGAGPLTVLLMEDGTTLDNQEKKP